MVSFAGYLKVASADLDSRAVGAIYIRLEFMKRKL